LFVFCFYEIDFTVTGTEAWTQMCASAGGFAMGYNPDMELWETTSGNRYFNPRSAGEKRFRTEDYDFLIAAMSFKCSSKTGMDLSAKLLTSASFVSADSALNALIAFLWLSNIPAM
jgi:hypothetical protein